MEGGTEGSSAIGQKNKGAANTMRAGAAPSPAQGQQIGKHVAFLLGRAFTFDHVLAIAFEPFFHFRGIRKALRIGGWSHRFYDFMSYSMVSRRSGIIRVASGTTPVATMTRLEELLATAGIETGKGSVIFLCLRGELGEEILRLMGPSRKSDDQTDQEADTCTFHGDYFLPWP